MPRFVALPIGVYVGELDSSIIQSVIPIND